MLTAQPRPQQRLRSFETRPKYAAASTPVSRGPCCDRMLPSPEYPDQAAQRTIDRADANDRNALVVDAEIRLEIPDQPRLRQIGLKIEMSIAGYRHQPPASTVLSGYRVRSTDEFWVHHHTPIDCRGLYSAGCHPATNASSFGSGFSGSISISLTYSSPLLPSARGTPRPFSLRTRPVFDHFGTATATAPPGVGTRTLAPSTASFSDIGRSR